MSTPLALALREVLSERDEHVSQVDHPHAYASEAQKCSRQIAFRLLAMPGTSELTTTSLLAFDLGNRLHDHVQRAFAKLYPDSFTPETPWAFPPDNLVTGRADGIYTNEDGERVVIEIKSMNPLTFSKCDRRGIPNYEHALQAHISAFVLGASLIHIVYVNKAGKQEDEPIIEWLAEADHAMAEIEIERLRSIVLQTNQGILPDTFYDGDTIDDPSRKKWPCAYCNWRDLCIQTGAGEKRLVHPTVTKRSATHVRFVAANDRTLESAS